MNILQHIENLSEFNKAILSALPFGISIVAENGKSVFFNKFFTDRKHCLDYLLKKHVKLNKPLATEILNCSDGKSYEITRSSIIFQNQKACLEIFVDITERKRIEDELHRSETKFRAIFQNSPVGIARFDNQGIITDCNKNYLQIKGATKKKIIGLNLLAYTGNKDYKKAVEQALKGKIGFFEGFYTTIANNKKLVIKAQFGPIILGGNVDGGIQILENITKQVANKKRLKTHTDKFERLTDDTLKIKLALENTFDGIVIANPDGKIVYANNTASTMAGRTPDEMIGQEMSVWGRLAENKNYFATIPFPKAWEKIKRITGYYDGELIHQNKNGETSITELHLAQVLNKNKEIIFFVATARDITKIKEVDRAKTEFVSLAAHELRTPLAGISLASELLLRYANDSTDEQKEKYLLEIFNSTKKMSALITDLLNISRIEMGTFNIKKEEIDLVKFIETILDNLKSQFMEKDISIQRQFDYNLPNIFFDKNALNLIADNLLINAIRYTPANGRVTVRLRYKKDNIVLAVSNTGSNIAIKERDKIFTKNFRSKIARKVAPEGEGLGLYIVKLTANKMGVKVWFENNKKILGTTFYVSIPTKSHTSNL